MNATNDIKRIEISIEQAKHAITQANHLNALRSNTHFVALFDDGYFKDEPIRLVYAKAAPALQDAEHQASIIKAMDSIGCLRDYLNNILRMGDEAAKALADNEEAREDMLKEEIEGEVA